MEDVSECLCDWAVDSGLFVALMDIAVDAIRVHMFGQVISSPIVVFHEADVDDWLSCVPLRPLPGITRPRFAHVQCPLHFWLGSSLLRRGWHRSPLGTLSHPR